MSTYYNGRRNIERHEKCQNGVNCTGAGCRVITGKTVRKANFARPRLNAHQAEATIKSSKPKGTR